MNPSLCLVVWICSAVDNFYLALVLNIKIPTFCAHSPKSNICLFLRPSLAQMVKRLSTMWETRVGSLGREDPLEKEMAAHSDSLAWKIPRTVQPGGYSPWGRKELDMMEQLHHHRPSCTEFSNIATSRHPTR